MQIRLIVEGGNMQPGPVLSQKIGPLGLNTGQIISKVNQATNDFKGLKVPVELEINTSTKEFEVKVFSPPTSELLKKELGVEKGSGEQEKVKVANASIEQIIAVTKTKIPNMLSKDLKSAVKTILGSCVSLGILVENKSPIEVIREIEEGKYDKEIEEEITITSEQKKVKLDKFFEVRKAKQERDQKALEAAKAAEEAAAGAEKPEGEAKPEETKETAKPEKK